MRELRKKSEANLERVAVKATRWIGSTPSLALHTLLFVGAFLLYFTNVDFNKVMLIVTTLVSLEAIYLSIFIQMSVNRQAAHLEEVAEDVGEIQEDVEEIQKDVDEIQEDVEGIEKDVDEIQEDVEEIQEEEDEDDKSDDAMLGRIEQTLGKLMEEIAELKRTTKKD